MDNRLRSKSDHTFIKELFDEYYVRLVHFSFQFIGDRDEAEDIVQDAFIKFWDYSTSIADNGLAIKSFLYTSVKNASLNVLRHNKVAEQHIQLQDRNPIEDSVIHAIVKSEVLSEIYKAVESLPASCQQISRLGYFEGKKNHEIAEELGISINTVKTQKQRALKLLRLRLSPEVLSLLILLTQV